MRAWRCVCWGGPEDLELGDLPHPECGPDQVKIAVKAWGVNFADLVLIEGRYQARPDFPFAPGMEVAGDIMAIGKAVGGFSLGDRVAAYVEYGGYADEVVAPASNVAWLPASVPLVTAAAFPVPYGTADLALERAALEAGTTVLVGGAGGAVGSACVELAAQRGCTVIACAGDEQKQRIARDCGAAHVVSSRSPDLRQEIRKLAPQGVDAVIDPIGGSFFEAALRTLAYGGRHVTLGFASGTIPSAALNHILVPHIGVIGSSFGLTAHLRPDRLARMWPQLVALLKEGGISPRIGAVMEFADLPAALRLLRDRKVAGRIVLK